MNRDVIVVGGGVIGCSIAWRLAQAGLKVTLFERRNVGCEASRAAAGMLSPQGEAQDAGPFFDLCLRSRAMYRGFAEELKDTSGIDVQYKDEGTLFVVLEHEDHRAGKIRILQLRHRHQQSWRYRGRFHVPGPFLHHFPTAGAAPRPPVPWATRGPGGGPCPTRIVDIADRDRPRYVNRRGDEEVAVHHSGGDQPQDALRRLSHRHLPYSG